MFSTLARGSSLTAGFDRMPVGAGLTGDSLLVSLSLLEVGSVTVGRKGTSLAAAKIWKPA